MALGTVLCSYGAMAQNDYSQQELTDMYNKAVRNSSYTANSKISNDLYVVAASNPKLKTKKIKGIEYVLAVSWKGDVSYFPKKSDSLWSTGGWDTWVTMAPELKDRVKHVDSSLINMRLKQLLGLPPGASYGYFVEYWVQAKDIFRPCPDKEITDNSCGLCFPPGTDSTHIRWINAQRLDRFFVCDTAQRYPWTELGYTYDWSPENASHVGCSEFVVRPNSHVYINRIYTTREYLYTNNE